MSSALRQRDVGSGTVLVMVAAMVVLMAATVFAGLVGAYTTHQRAATAADLAAIAGATHPDRACDVAARVVAAHGVVLDGCLLVGDDVLVTVSADLPEILRRMAPSGRAAPIIARARAGPA